MTAITNQILDSNLYDIALRSIYDELYELNLTQNRYRIIYHVEDKHTIPAKEGVLDETMLEIAQNCIHPEDKNRFLSFLNLDGIDEALIAGNGSIIGEFRKRCVDGIFRWASLTVFRARLLETQDKMLLCFVMDIGYKKQLDEIERKNIMLQKQQMDDERYRLIIEQTKTHVFEWVVSENKRYYSPKMKETFAGNYDKRDIKTIWLEDEVVHPTDVALLEQGFKIKTENRNHVTLELRLCNREKRYIWCRVSFSLIYDEDGRLQRVIGTLNDIDKAKRAHETLKYRAEFDMLTGIHNINTFYGNTKKLLANHIDCKYAVIRMDINRFKFINELYGRDEGNGLLRCMATVIAKNMTLNDTYGRMNGDVFCMCMTYSSEIPLLPRIQKILSEINGFSDNYHISPCCGICIVKDRAIPISVLCDWAHLAQKTVKGSLIQHWAVYNKKLRIRQLDEQEIENEMEEALSQKQFKIFLQPKHNLQNGVVIGAEALVRWEHPTKGLITPFYFIPLFERNGFIIKLDEYVWEETCRVLKSWIDCGFTPVPVSVNVSRVHVYNPNFYKKLLTSIRKYDIPRNLLEVELTESSFVENTVELYKNMEKLQEAGIIFSMDDFGSGYSSLNMLKNVPVNTIKLDREFLNDSVATKKGKTIIAHTIGMIKDLNLNVIAEGVETIEQAGFLEKCGCLAAQGYYYSKPMVVEEFERRFLDMSK